MLTAMWHWQTNEFEAGRPLLEALHLRVPTAPRAFLQQLLRKGRICSDGTPLAGQVIVSSGLPITVLPSNRFAELVEACGVPPQALLFEDRYALVIDKPAGLAMHRSVGHDDNLVTRVERLVDLRHAGHRVAAVHRLDVGTSGAVLFGKGHWAIGQYGRQLMDGQVGKHYLALVSGPVPARGELATPVPEGGVMKAALSRYRRMAATAALALLDLELVTGRQHQARRQLADAGWPIVGDRRYGGAAWPHLDHPLLHCRQLQFASLDDGQPRQVTSPLPAPFARLIADIGMPVPMVNSAHQGNFFVSNGEERV